MSQSLPQEYIWCEDAIAEIKVRQLCFPLLTCSTFSFSEAVLASCCWLQCCALFKYLLGKTKENEAIKKKSEVLWDHWKWIIIKQFCLTAF